MRVDQALLGLALMLMFMLVAVLMLMLVCGKAQPHLRRNVEISFRPG